MREARRKLSQRRQPVALLLHPRGLANPVGHQADEPLRQLRHLVDKVGKQRGREAQSAAIRERSHAYAELLHAGKREHARHGRSLDRNHYRFAAEFAACLQLPLEDDEHRVGRFTRPKRHVPRFEVHLFRLAEKPFDLIVGQIGERGNANQF